MLGVVDAWRTDLAVQCEAGVAATDVPLALAALEGALARSAQAVADLQGPYQAFYGSLDGEQRAHIDEAILRHQAKHQ